MPLSSVIRCSCRMAARRGPISRAAMPMQLYRSIKKVLSLPSGMRLFMCHDYAPGGREIRWQTSVGEERRNNVHVRDGVSEEAFVDMRKARDKTLGMPKLIIPSIQVNIRGGQLPPPDKTGKRFLKVPLNQL